MDEFDRRVTWQLGRRIRRRRQYVELSQEALAERAGICRTQISLLELGQRMPLTSSLIKVGAGLGISVGRLVDGIEWEVVAGAPLRDPGREDPWEPGQDGGRAAEEP